MQRQEGKSEFAESIVYNLHHQILLRTKQMERREQMIEQVLKQRKEEPFMVEHTLDRIKDALKSSEQWYDSSTSPRGS